jgi:hypothetical protein
LNTRISLFSLGRYCLENDIMSPTRIED